MTQKLTPGEPPDGEPPDGEPDGGSNKGLPGASRVLDRRRAKPLFTTDVPVGIAVCRDGTVGS